MAWINGMMNVIIAEGLYAKEYVDDAHEGFEEVRKIVDEVHARIRREDLGHPGRAAQGRRPDLRHGAEAPPSSTPWASPSTATGTDNVKSLANLAMLCGKVGIEGGGVNPLRGQNNVQGACDMGCLPNVFPAYQNGRHG